MRKERAAAAALYLNWILRGCALKPFSAQAANYTLNLYRGIIFIVFLIIYVTRIVVYCANLVYHCNRILTLRNQSVFHPQLTITDIFEYGVRTTLSQSKNSQRSHQGST